MSQGIAGKEESVDRAQGYNGAKPVGDGGVVS